MKELVAIVKEANKKQRSSPTRSDNSIQRLRNKPEMQLGSLRDVVCNIRRNGDAPSVESISTELSVMPTSNRASALLALQQTQGNQYVQRVVTGIQAKLKVGQPEDIYEQEADRVAEQVVRMPDDQVQWQVEPEEEEEKKEELIGTKALSDQITPLVQRQVVEEEEEEDLQTKEILCKTPEVTADFETRIQALKGRGQPLPKSVRNFLEPRFSNDFSRVRVHSDAHAAETAQALKARAFSMGRDVVFGTGQYAPGTKEGQRLLAHELTHVVQQQSIEGTIRRFPADEDECLGYQPGEISTSRTASGHLDPDVTLHAPGRLLIADFGVGRQSVKPSTQAEPLLRSWLSTFESDNSYRLSIAGYSDCVGSDSVNTRIRRGRAEQVERLLERGARSRVTFRGMAGMAGLGDYVAHNNTIENRARNRGVIIEFHQEFTIPPTIIIVPPPHGYRGSKAASYARKYALSPNLAYHEYPNDCTNFVSQALHDGGWSMIFGKDICGERRNDNVWWYRRDACKRLLLPNIHASHTWGGAENFRRFIASSGRGSLAPDVKSLQIGDVLQMNFSGGGTAGHTMIVTKKSSTNISLSYHTTNTLDAPFYDEGKKKGIYTRYPKASYFPWQL